MIVFRLYVLVKNRWILIPNKKIKITRETTHFDWVLLFQFLAVYCPLVSPNIWSLVQTICQVKKSFYNICIWFDNPSLYIEHTIAIIQINWGSLMRWLKCFSSPVQDSTIVLFIVHCKYNLSDHWERLWAHHHCCESSSYAQVKGMVPISDCTC